MEKLNKNNIKLLKEGTVGILAWARWNEKANTVHSIASRISKESPEKIRFFEIETKNNQDLYMELRVKSIPTIIFLYNGKEFLRHRGMIDYRGLRDILNSLDLRIRVFKKSLKERIKEWQE